MSLGISPATLYAKKRDFMEFSEGLKRGRARGIRAVANKLYEAPIEGSTVAMILFLKARAGWRDAGDGAVVNISVGEAADSERQREERMAVIEMLTIDDGARCGTC